MGRSHRFNAVGSSLLSSRLPTTPWSDLYEGESAMHATGELAPLLLVELADVSPLARGGDGIRVVAS
jgi:hypothetical protein